MKIIHALLLLAANLIITVAQECVDKHNSLRECIADNPPKFRMSFATFNECFRKNGCTAPVLEEVFLKFFEKYHPSASQLEKARTCINQIVFPAFEGLENCVRNERGFKWYFARYSDEEYEMLYVLSASHERSLGFLCDGSGAKMREVHYCLNRNNINVRRLKHTACSAVNTCEAKIGGISSQCQSYTRIMSRAACGCVRKMFIENDAELMERLTECYLGELPPGFDQMKANLAEDIHELPCDNLRDSFNLHERWQMDC